MRLLNFKFLILFVCLNLFNHTIFATPEEEVDNFLSHIGNMRSFAIDFMQIDSKGTKANGTLLIHKPANFRCNYYPPFPLLIAGNKNYISMYDYQMEALSRMEASENIFNFLLMTHVDMTKHFDISVLSSSEDTIKVQLNHEESGRHSEIVIDRHSKQLKELKIFEPKNTIVVTFSNLRTVSNFDKDLFMIETPRAGIQVEQLTRKQLEQKFQ